LHFGYFILHRDIFADGVFYIPLKALREKSLGYQMKDLLYDTLGIDVQFGFLSQLKNKDMLLIFDDFDLLYDEEIEYCRLFFRAVKQCKIACIAITTLDSQFLQKSPEREQEITTELLDKDLRWELHGLSEQDLLLMLQAYIKHENDRHSIKLDELKTLDIVHQCQGNPQQVLDSLIAGELKLGEKVLELDPAYKEALEFEKGFTTDLELLSIPSVQYSRFLSSHSDYRTYARGLNQSDFHQMPASHKARSFRFDNNNHHLEVPFTKNRSIVSGVACYPSIKRIDHHLTKEGAGRNQRIDSGGYLKTLGGVSDRQISNVDPEESVSQSSESERKEIPLLRTHSQGCSSRGLFDVGHLKKKRSNFAIPNKEKELVMEESSDKENFDENELEC